MQLTAILTPAAEGGYVALNPETGTTTQGDTIEDALAQLREATALYLEECPLQTTGQALLTTFKLSRACQYGKVSTIRRAFAMSGFELDIR